MITMTATDKITTKIREYFRDKPVLKAYMVGSYARSESVIDSDIDILVELDYSDTIGLEFVKMKLDDL